LLTFKVIGMLSGVDCHPSLLDRQYPALQSRLNKAVLGEPHATLGLLPTNGDEGAVIAAVFFSPRLQPSGSACIQNSDGTVSHSGTTLASSMAAQCNERNAGHGLTT
jgi:hypothetical protein